MSTGTVSSGAAVASSSDDRWIVGGGYLLLGAAPLTFGLSGLAAVVVAHLRRPGADRWLRGHYVFQIRSFWSAAFFAVPAVLSIAFGLFMLDGTLDGPGAPTSAGLDAMFEPIRAVLRLHPVGVLSLLAGVAGVEIAATWLVVAALYGLSRLAWRLPARR